MAALPRVPTKPHLSLLYYMATVLVLVVLLVVDVDFKARHFASSDSNSFFTATYGDLRETPLVPIDLDVSMSERALSSWPHFLSSCDNLTAFDSGGGFMVLALGTNCTLGPRSTRRTVGNIVVSSTVRLDSIVWSCCKLLYPSQQPSICQDHIATDFLNRYLFADIAVSIGDLAREGSEEEAEIQVFLDMVSRSYPLNKMVCVEGFVWPNRTLGYYNTSIYGCASPNSFRSEFVGLFNPKMRDMLWRRVWLSGDTFEILGMRIGIRQNSKSVFSIEETSAGTLVATAHVDTNFSCFGPLYTIMLVMDLMILLIYIHAGYESAKWILGPQYKKIVTKQNNSGRLASSVVVSEASVKRLAGPADASTVPTSPSPESVVRRLTRSRSAASLKQVAPTGGSISLGTLASKPDRNDVLEGVVYCSLFNNWLVGVFVVGSQMLSWIFILPNIVIWSWSLVESAKIRAGITSFRAVVLVMISVDLCWAGVVKLNEEFAYFVSSRTFVSPLEIMLVSAGVASWKFPRIMLIADQKWDGENQRSFDYVGFPGYLALGNMFDGSQDFQHGTPFHVFAIVYKPLFEVVAFSILFTAIYVGLKGVAIYAYHARRQQAYPYDAEDNGQHGHEYGEYHRLTDELLLDFPIRARCLLRNNLSMEMMIDNQRVIRPSCYLDSGILPRDGNPG